LGINTFGVSAVDATPEGEAALPGVKGFVGGI